MQVLDALVKSGDLESYEHYRGMSGDDLLYLVLPSGRELHITATIVDGYAVILKVKAPRPTPPPPGWIARFFTRVFGSW